MRKGVNEQVYIPVQGIRKVQPDHSDEEVISWDPKDGNKEDALTIFSPMPSSWCICVDVSVFHIESSGIFLELFCG